MIWLDATDPGPNDPGYDPTKPWGNPRGTCNQARGQPRHHPNRHP